MMNLTHYQPESCIRFRCSRASFVVRNVIISLDKEIKATRALLLIIPEDVMDDITDLPSFVTEG